MRFWESIFGKFSKNNENNELFGGNDSGSAKKTGKKNGPLQSRRLQMEQFEERVLLSVTGCDDRICAYPLPELPEGIQGRDSNLGIYAGNLVAPLSETFMLNSNPGSNFTIYLDFHGGTTSDSYWWNEEYGYDSIVTPVFSLDDDTGFSDAELEMIQNIWAWVSEDFAPFDINVTTQLSTFDQLTYSGPNDATRGIRVLIGGDGMWYRYDESDGTVGVGMTHTFSSETDDPCFVFSDLYRESNNAAMFEKGVSETISHEVGHTLSLLHHGYLYGSAYELEYYMGHNDWAPIMGFSDYMKLTQWSNGDYFGATKPDQDDIALMMSNHGFGYRADDHGDTTATATVLTPDATGNFSIGGIVETRTDYDVFRIEVANAGMINLDVIAGNRDANLDVYLELLDANGTLIELSNPLGTLGASLSHAASPGTYYVRISGTGKGDPLDGGYSDYGSLGHYTLSGTVPLSGGVTPSGGDFELRAVFLNQDTTNNLITDVAYNIAPNSLLLRFDEGVAVNEATLKGIRVYRSGGDGKFDREAVGKNWNDYEILISCYIHDVRTNEVIIQFGENLVDDLYEIHIVGDMFRDDEQYYSDSSGVFVGLENFVNRAKSSTSPEYYRKIVPFKLNLAPQVTAVVPQPTYHESNISLVAGSYKAGDRFTISDGINPPVVFQFTTAGVDSAKPVGVDYFVAYSANATTQIQNIHARIQKAVDDNKLLFITGLSISGGVITFGGPGVFLTNSPLTILDLDISPNNLPTVGATFTVFDGTRTAMFEFVPKSASGETIPEKTAGGNYAIEMAETSTALATNVSKAIALATKELLTDLSGVGSTQTTSRISIRGYNLSATSVTGMTVTTEVTGKGLTVKDGTLKQERNTIEVYFNDDELMTLPQDKKIKNDARAELDPKFFTLFVTQDTLNTDDDFYCTPTWVTYEYGVMIGGQKVNRAILHFEDVTVYRGNGSLLKTETITDLSELGTGSIRLRIGNEYLPTDTRQLDLTYTDAGDAFYTAIDINKYTGDKGNDNFETAPEGNYFNTSGVDQQSGDLIGPQSLIIRGQILATYDPIENPGGRDNPGHRDLPYDQRFYTGRWARTWVDYDEYELYTKLDYENHLYEANRDVTDGPTVIYYNFKSDINGSGYKNEITEAQKDLSRMIFEMYSRYLGVIFIETEGRGITVATGDLAAVGMTSGQGRTCNYLEAWDELALMDKNHDWGESVYGGSWFETAIHEIGHSIGLLHAYDVNGSCMGGTDGQDTWPGLTDILHGLYLYRTDSNDIDVYQFSVDHEKGGTFSAEIFAERASNASNLNAVLTLYKEVVKYVDLKMSDGSTVQHKQISYEVVARNDDYFSNDSFFETYLPKGKYFICVSSTGNDEFNPNMEDTGEGGRTDGKYSLRLNFTAKGVDPNDPLATDYYDPEKSTFKDASGTEFLVDTTGVKLDGDYNAIPGGIYDYWFSVQKSVDTAGQWNALNELNDEWEGLKAPLRADFAATTRGDELYKTAMDNYKAETQRFLTRLEELNRTIFVDNSSRTYTGKEVDAIDSNRTRDPSLVGEGTISNPFRTIHNALYYAEMLQNLLEQAGAGDSNIVVRIVGNNMNDDDYSNPSTLTNNKAYEVGINTRAANKVLTDGATFDVPKGVSLVIDAGVAIKFAGTSLNVGSTSQYIDHSGGSVQLLGTPARSVLLTSYYDETIGVDTYSNNTTGQRGDWGGIVVRNDIDNNYIENYDPASGKRQRVNSESQGIFLNYINHGDIRYGGGYVGSMNDQVIYNPIHMIESRPTISFNKVMYAADAAISADPRSFEETRFQTWDYNSGKFDLNESGTADTHAFTTDYTRVGPSIYGNYLNQNAQNGLLVKVQTGTQDIKKFDVSARFDDFDIVHIISENIVIAGNPGGNIADLTTAPSVLLLSQPGFSVNAIPSSGETFTVSDGVTTFTYEYCRFYFDEKTGLFYGRNDVKTGHVPINIWVDPDGTVWDYEIDDNGVWKPLSKVTGNAAIAANVAKVTTRVINDIDEQLEFRSLVAENYKIKATQDGSNVYLASSGPELNMIGFGVQRAGLLKIDSLKNRLNGSLVVDPGLILKTYSARIEIEMGAQLIAEGTAEQPIVITSFHDLRYGASGSFNTIYIDSGVVYSPNPGDWSGINVMPNAYLSLDHAKISYAGGFSRIEGTTARFNPIEVHEGDARITNSRFELNTGIGNYTESIDDRQGRGTATAAVIYVHGSQPIIVNNEFLSNKSWNTSPSGDFALAVISINANSMTADNVVDHGRSIGAVDRFTEYSDNYGPMIRDNRMTDNTINGMVVRGSMLATESVWDDADIVHVLYNEIVVDNYHHVGGLRLLSQAGNSLVIKLFGNNAGFTTMGTDREYDDRIGGSMQIIGVPGYPVIMTSLRDDSVGAGFTIKGDVVYDTNNDKSATTASAGNWRGVKFGDLSNDRNVQVIREYEKSSDRSESNGTRGTAQYLGVLATEDKAGDDTLRLGFEVHGSIRNTDAADVDVYQFQAFGGTEMWIDIDFTNRYFDSIIEVVDANGNVVARSDNSFYESLYGEAYYDTDTQTWKNDYIDRVYDKNASTATRGTTTGYTSNNNAFPLQDSYWDRMGNYGSNDLYSTNLRDAGLRFVTTGASDTLMTYYVRVRSAVGMDGVNQIQSKDGILRNRTAEELAELNGKKFSIYNSLTNQQIVFRLDTGSSTSSTSKTERNTVIVGIGNLGASTVADRIVAAINKYATQANSNISVTARLAKTSFTDPNPSIILDGVNLVFDPDTSGFNLHANSSGNYVMQIRLQDTDEVPGCSVYYAEMRYATTAIEVIGFPQHSSTQGEASENAASKNYSNVTYYARNAVQTRVDGFAQMLGNLASNDLGTLSVAGRLDNLKQVDWYAFTLNVDGLRVENNSILWSAIFDLDYADGRGQTDLTMYVYNHYGQLIFMGTDSNISDDRSERQYNQDSTVSSIEKLTAGSSGAGDPYIGSVILPTSHNTWNYGDQATYYVAVTSKWNIPTVISDIQNIEYSGGQWSSISGSAGTRIEPINTILRVVEERVEQGQKTQSGTEVEASQRLVLTADEYHLGDVVAYSTRPTGINLINGFTGLNESTNNTNNGNTIANDVALRFDGRLVTTRTSGNTTYYREINQAASGGSLSEIDTTLHYWYYNNAWLRVNTNFSTYAMATSNYNMYYSSTYQSAFTVVIGENPNVAYPGGYSDTYPSGLTDVPAGRPVLIPNPVLFAEIGVKADDTPTAAYKYDFSDTGAWEYVDIGGGELGWRIKASAGTTLQINAATIAVLEGVYTGNANDIDAANALREAFEALSTGNTYDHDGNPDTEEVPCWILAWPTDHRVTPTYTYEHGLKLATNTATKDELNTGANYGQQSTKSISIYAGYNTLGTKNVMYILDANGNAVNWGVGYSGTNDGITKSERYYNSIVPHAVFGPENGLLDANETITGAQFFYYNGQDRLIVATDQGRIYEIENYKSYGFYKMNPPASRTTWHVAPYAAGTGPSLNYLGTVYTDTGATFKFSSLTKGPANVEGGIYSDMLFGLGSTALGAGGTASGDTLIAFKLGSLSDTDPNAGRPVSPTLPSMLQPIFVNGAKSVTVPSGTGICFSPIDYNLWHRTYVYNDPIYGSNDGMRYTTGTTSRSNASWYFGLENHNNYNADIIDTQPGAVAYESKYDAGDPNSLNTFNVPGGAYGALTSNDFSLKGYVAEDKPTIYFSYKLGSGDNDRPIVYACSDTIGWTAITQRWDYPANDVDSLSGQNYVTGLSGYRTEYLYDKNGNRLYDSYGNLLKVDGNYTINDDVWRQARVDLSAFAGQEGVKLRFVFSTGGGAIGLGNGSGSEQDLNKTGTLIGAVPAAAIIDNRTNTDNMYLDGYNPITMLPDGSLGVTDSNFMIGNQLYKFSQGYSMFVPTTPGANGRTTGNEKITIRGLNGIESSATLLGILNYHVNGSTNTSTLSLEDRQDLYSRYTRLNSEEMMKLVIDWVGSTTATTGVTAHRYTERGGNVNAYTAWAGENPNVGQRLYFENANSVTFTEDTIGQPVTGFVVMGAAQDNTLGELAAMTLTEFYNWLTAKRSGGAVNYIKVPIRGDMTAQEVAASMTFMVNLVNNDDMYTYLGIVMGTSGSTVGKFIDDYFIFGGAVQSLFDTNGTPNLRPDPHGLVNCLSVSTQRLERTLRLDNSSVNQLGTGGGYGMQNANTMTLVSKELTTTGPLVPYKSDVGTNTWQNYTGAFNYTGTFFDGSSTSTARANDNKHYGFAIDNIIVGAAERGEMVTNAPGYGQYEDHMNSMDIRRINDSGLSDGNGNYSETRYFYYPDDAATSADYQLEIRRGTETYINAPSNYITSQTHTNERLTDGITIVVPDVSDLYHGQRFALSDGVKSVEFVFLNRNLGTVGAGNAEVIYFSEKMTRFELWSAITSAISKQYIAGTTSIQSSNFTSPEFIDLFRAVDFRNGGLSPEMKPGETEAQAAARNGEGGKPIKHIFYGVSSGLTIVVPEAYDLYHGQRFSMSDGFKSVEFVFVNVNLSLVDYPVDTSNAEVIYFNDQMDKSYEAVNKVSLRTQMVTAIGRQYNSGKTSIQVGLSNSTEFINLLRAVEFKNGGLNPEMEPGETEAQAAVRNGEGGKPISFVFYSSSSYTPIFDQTSSATEYYSYYNPVAMNTVAQNDFGSNLRAFISDTNTLTSRLFVDRNTAKGERIGDENTTRQKGQLNIYGVTITNASNYGISVTPRTINLQGGMNQMDTNRMVTGVSIVNNVIAFCGQGGINIQGASNAYLFARIVNNTIYGTVDGRQGIGINVGQYAAPTIMNNIIANLENGIQVENLRTDYRGVKYLNNLYQRSDSQSDLIIRNENIISSIVLDLNDPLFLDPANGNFYPDARSLAIDGSASSLLERRMWWAMYLEQLGIPESTIVAPVTDIYGQIREAVLPGGPGANTNIDIGAIDRSDLYPPDAELIYPWDRKNETDPTNNPNDYDTSLYSVLLLEQTVRYFRISLTDKGTGIDVSSLNEDLTLKEDIVQVIKKSWDYETNAYKYEILKLNSDYFATYNGTTGYLTITPQKGEWDANSTYSIILNNDTIQYWDSLVPDFKRDDEVDDLTRPSVSDVFKSTDPLVFWIDGTKVEIDITIENPAYVQGAGEPERIIDPEMTRESLVEKIVAIVNAKNLVRGNLEGGTVIIKAEPIVDSNGGTTGVRFRNAYDVACGNYLFSVESFGEMLNNGNYVLQQDRTGIQDNARNPLSPNQENGQTRFTIVFASYDYGDAPEGIKVDDSLTYQFPTIWKDDGTGGPRHIIYDGFSLGERISSEIDGRPSLHPTVEGDQVHGDTYDDGVKIVELVPGQNAIIEINVNANNPLFAANADEDGFVGYVVFWIDFNGNGKWSDTVYSEMKWNEMTGMYESVDGTINADGEKFVVKVKNGVNKIVIPIPSIDLSSGGDSVIRVGDTYARFRLISNAEAERIGGAGKLTQKGEARDGEVEDYRFVMSRFAKSYGDAPNKGTSALYSYPVLASENGAWHAIGGDAAYGPNGDQALYFGSLSPLSMLDGAPSRNADKNTTDDGIKSTNKNGFDSYELKDMVFVWDKYASITVTATIPADFLDEAGDDLVFNRDVYASGWFDWNRDGAWDASEYVRLFTFANNSLLNVDRWTEVRDSTTDELIGYRIEQKCDIKAPNLSSNGVEATFARFRISTDDSITKPDTGFMNTTDAPIDGEVEDYMIYVGPQQYDYGDAPATYGPVSHAIVGGTYLGTGVTAERDPRYYPLFDDDGEFNLPNAQGDDTRDIAFPWDDSRTKMVVYENGTTEFTVYASKTGRLSIWIDTNANGEFDASERISDPRTGEMYFELTAGLNILKLDLPSLGILGSKDTWARFRYTDDTVDHACLGPTDATSTVTEGGALGTPAPNGEVVDHQLTIYSRSLTVTGTVFSDLNANGKFDVSDRGTVPVVNQGDYGTSGALLPFDAYGMSAVFQLGFVFSLGGDTYTSFQVSKSGAVVLGKGTYNYDFAYDSYYGTLDISRFPAFYPFYRTDGLSVTNGAQVKMFAGKDYVQINWGNEFILHIGNSDSGDFVSFIYKNINYSAANITLGNGVYVGVGFGNGSGNVIDIGNGPDKPTMYYSTGTDAVFKTQLATFLQYAAASPNGSIGYRFSTQNGMLRSEKGVAGETVFIDLNNNGIWDPDEPKTVTDSDGSFSFNVYPGNYSIVHARDTDFSKYGLPTIPGTHYDAAPGNYYYNVSLVEGGPSASGIDFGYFSAGSIGIGHTTVVESGGYAELELILKDSFGAAIKVEYETLDGTARAGSDYTYTIDSVVIGGDAIPRGDWNTNLVDSASSSAGLYDSSVSRDTLAFTKKDDEGFWQVHVQNPNFNGGKSVAVTTLNDGNENLAPQVLETDDGKVHIVWLSYNGLTYNLMYASADVDNLDMLRREPDEVSPYGTDTLQNKTAYNCQNPQISADATGNVYVAWTSVNKQTGYGDVYFLDVSRNSCNLSNPIVASSFSAHQNIKYAQVGSLALDGGNLVWASNELGDQNIYLYSYNPIKTVSVYAKQISKIGENSTPAISGDIVTWRHRPIGTNMKSDIALYNISVEKRICISGQAYDYRAPVIGEEWLVWEVDNGASNSNFDILSYRLSNIDWLSVLTDARLINYDMASQDGNPGMKYGNSWNTYSNYSNSTLGISDKDSIKAPTLTPIIKTTVSSLADLDRGYFISQGISDIEILITNASILADVLAHANAGKIRRIELQGGVPASLGALVWNMPGVESLIIQGNVSAASLSINGPALKSFQINGGVVSGRMNIYAANLATAIIESSIAAEFYLSGGTNMKCKFAGNITAATTVYNAETLVFQGEVSANVSINVSGSTNVHTVTFNGKVALPQTPNSRILIQGARLDGLYFNADLDAALNVNVLCPDVSFNAAAAGTHVFGGYWYGLNGTGPAVHYNGTISGELNLSGTGVDRLFFNEAVNAPINISGDVRTLVFNGNVNMSVKTNADALGSVYFNGNVDAEIDIFGSALHTLVINGAAVTPISTNSVNLKEIHVNGMVSDPTVFTNSALEVVYTNMSLYRDLLTMLNNPENDHKFEHLSVNIADSVFRNVTQVNSGDDLAAAVYGNHLVWLAHDQIANRWIVNYADLSIDSYIPVTISDNHSDNWNPKISSTGRVVWRNSTLDKSSIYEATLSQAQTSVKIRIPINNDIIPENDEYFFVRIVAASFVNLPDLDPGLVTQLQEQLIDKLRNIGVVWILNDDGAMSMGTAPDTYRTSTANIGPRHLTTSANNPILGPSLVNKSDGVEFLDPIVPGKEVRIKVTVSQDCVLNAFFDWNGNGSFGAVDLASTLLKAETGTEPHLVYIDKDGAVVDYKGEAKIDPITGEVRGVGGMLLYTMALNMGSTTERYEQFTKADGSTDYQLLAGVNEITIMVPDDAVPGETWSRFRVSKDGGLSFFGYVDNGDVEDHKITIQKPVSSVSFENGVIYINGSVLYDTVEVYLQNPDRNNNVTVKLNRLKIKEFNFSEVTGIVFNGMSGNDTVTVYGTDSMETVKLDGDRSLITTAAGAGFDMSIIGAKTINFHGYGGDDTVTVQDTNSSDALKLEIKPGERDNYTNTLYRAYGKFQGGGLKYNINDVKSLYVLSTNGGVDSAKISAGQAQVTVMYSGDFVSMSAGSNGSLIQLYNFDRVKLTGNTSSIVNMLGLQGTERFLDFDFSEKNEKKKTANLNSSNINLKFADFGRYSVDTTGISDLDVRVIGTSKVEYLNKDGKDIRYYGSPNAVDSALLLELLDFDFDLSNSLKVKSGNSVGTKDLYDDALEDVLDDLAFWDKKS